jgi:branched-chain amino acid aminotransferase
VGTAAVSGWRLGTVIAEAKTVEEMTEDFSQGSAYVDGHYVPLGQAAIPITDWGYRRSDATYDVVSVWRGMFFRLDDHIDRFRRSMNGLRLSPSESNDDIKKILHRCVRLSGLREAYVAVDCLRGSPPPGGPYHPAYCRNYIVAFCRPWISLMAPDVQARGANLVIAETPRIPEDSIDPTIKNFHWGDLTRGLFEAHDAGADGCILLDHRGFVTEGPGYNLFCVRNGEVLTPDRGVLDGITRRSIKELCHELGLPVFERPIPSSTLFQCDEVFVTTTAGGPMPVARVDSHVMCIDRPGPVSAHLKNAYWKKRESGWHATRIDYSEPL